MTGGLILNWELPGYDRGHPTYFFRMTVETACPSTTSTSAPVTFTVDTGKIAKQVEFYFSDYNMPRDRFLQEEAKKNEEGWIGVLEIV